MLYLRQTSLQQSCNSLRTSAVYLFGNHDDQNVKLMSEYSEHRRKETSAGTQQATLPRLRAHSGI